MANLYITEQNSILRKTGDRLIVEKDDEILLDVQCHKIDAVMIFGNVQFTTQAVTALFDQGIEMSILTRNGRLKGQISSPVKRNIHLRITQFKRFFDDAFRLTISKIIVDGKIRNSINFLHRFAYNHPEVDLNDECAGIEELRKKIGGAEGLDSLLGLEGAAARLHFKALGKMVLTEFRFENRTKRPPEDPVNALLSLTYTLIFNEISSLLDGVGFDPYLGFYHHPDYGRASLAADITEAFRTPVADRFVLKLVNTEILNPDDFYTAHNSGVLLKRDALKRYFAEYEKFLNQDMEHPVTKEKTTLRKSYRLQAENMAAAVQGIEDYRPFILEV